MFFIIFRYNKLIFPVMDILMYISLCDRNCTVALTLYLCVCYRQKRTGKFPLSREELTKFPPELNSVNIRDGLLSCIIKVCLLMQLYASSICYIHMCIVGAVLYVGNN